MTVILVTSQEKVPIFPLLGADAIVPDEVVVVPIGTDVKSITDDQFAAPTTDAGQTAVWVKDLDGGHYGVVCRMNPQGDQQRPVWQLAGEIIVNRIVTA